jgi:hypothetical protein
MGACGGTGGEGELRADEKLITKFKEVFSEGFRMGGTMLFVKPRN